MELCRIVSTVDLLIGLEFACAFFCFLVGGGVRLTSSELESSARLRFAEDTCGEILGGTLDWTNGKLLSAAIGSGESCGSSALCFLVQLKSVTCDHTMNELVWRTGAAGI